MNPSFVRLQIPLAWAVPRVAAWIGLPEIEAPRAVSFLDASRAACGPDGRWRGAALFAYETAEGSAFDDLSGCLAALEPERWRALAGDGWLQFCGYDDAVPYGELVRVWRGQVVRAFFEDATDPSVRRNLGTDPPLRSWIDVAGLVDEDPIAGPGVETGLLLLFGLRAEEEEAGKGKGKGKGKGRGDETAG
jgi:hypothetical protein